MHELSSCYWVPKSDFSDALRRDLTFEVYPLNGDPPTVVEAFRTDRKGWVGVPRQFGLQRFTDRYTDALSDGHPAAFPRSIKLLDYQVPFVQAILDTSETEIDFIAKAGTGKGKTVCALKVAERRARTTVVIVDQENLMEQWIERCQQHLGLGRDDIGVVQGKKCTYRDKAVTICMMQTLASRRLPEEFYAYFGTMIVDECHTAGAPTYSAVLMMFSASLRLGLSATPKRKDVLAKVISMNIGEVMATMEDEHARSAVYLMPSFSVYSYQANSAKMAGRYLSEIADDPYRNLQAAHATKWLFESGRDVLVIGDRVEQLTSLMLLCEAIGVPRSEMGLYAKTRTSYRFEKDPRPARRPYGYERGTEYTPVIFRLVQTTIPKRERDAVKESCRVIFATYGIMAKGVDIPRLSAGIDVTPRSDATQVLGRILRLLKGMKKLIPIWVTIADVNSYRALHQLVSRLGDYEASNAEVFLWDRNKGRKALNVRALKSSLRARVDDLKREKTITRTDGSYTLPTPSMLTDSDGLLETLTESLDRPRRN